MPPRLAPVDPPYAPAVDDALQRLMGRRPGAEPLALFRTLAHHEPLLERFRQVGSSLLSFGRLEAADRETIIHRTTANCAAGYEWGVHAALFAPALGLDAAWLRATWAGGGDDPAFTPRQALLVAACDELHATGALTDATFAGLREAYDDDQLVEVVCLAGFYHLVSFVCGAFGVEPEPWAVAPPGR